MFFSTAFAQEAQLNLPNVETQEGEVDPGSAVSPMKIGQKSPFSGILLSPKLIATVLAKLKSIDGRVSLATQEARETSEEVCRNEKNVAKIKSDADVSVLRARIDDNERNLQSYEQRLKLEIESQQSPALLLGLGAAAGTAVTFLAVFAVAQSMK